MPSSSRAFGPRCPRSFSARSARGSPTPFIGCSSSGSALRHWLSSRRFWSRQVEPRTWHWARSTRPTARPDVLTNGTPPRRATTRPTSWRESRGAAVPVRRLRESRDGRGDPPREGAGTRDPGKRVVEAPARPRAVWILRPPHTIARAHDGSSGSVGPRRPLGPFEPHPRVPGVQRGKEIPAARRVGSPPRPPGGRSGQNLVDNLSGPSVGCARVDRGYTAPSRSDLDGSAGRSGSSRGPAVGGRFSVAGAWARVVGAPRKEVVQPCVAVNR